MSPATRSTRTVFRFGRVLAVLMVTGCAGMEPYEARDERVEGPKRGVFSGADGEFVIFRSGDKPNPDEEEKKPEATSRE